MKNLLPLFLVCCAATSYGQQNIQSAINISGGSFQKGYYQFEWSVGETALVDQMEEPNRKLIVTNGLLQPYLVYPATTSTQPRFEFHEIRIFPNPSTEYVEINFSTKHSGKLTLNLYSATGQIIYTKELDIYGVDKIERIPVASFPQGIYTLHVELKATEGSVSKRSVYKIVKM